MRFFLSTISHAYGTIKPPWWAAINQIRSHVIKMASEKARLSDTKRLIELWHEEESLWNILSDNLKIRQEKEKSVGRMSEKLDK